MEIFRRDSIKIVLEIRSKNVEVEENEDIGSL